MPSNGDSPTVRTDRRTELADALVSNAVPIVGVVALDWSAATLLILYWFELGVDAFWAFVRALFAGRPPALDPDGLLLGPIAARRISLSVPRTGLRIYLGTLLSLPIGVVIVAIGWLFAGAVLVGPLETTPFETGNGASVMLATVAVFTTTGASTVRNYFADGTYRHHNSQTAFGGLLFKMIGVFFGGLLTLTLLAASTEGPEATIGSVEPATVGLPLLLVVICIKFGSDLLRVYSDRLAVYFQSFDERYGWLEPPPNPESIERPLSDPPRRLRPTFWGRLLGGPLRLHRHPGVAYIGAAGLVGAALFAIGAQWRIVVTICAGTLVVVVGLLCLDQALRYGTVEYRVAPDAGRLVAYDRVAGTALWAVQSWDERGLRVAQTPLDTLLGTETVVLELADDEYLLPHLPDAAPIVAVFDR